MKTTGYKRHLTDTMIRALKSKNQLIISDTRIPGLQLRYYPKTRRVSFYLGYMVKNTRIHRIIFLGCYGEFKLEEIRNRALAYRHQVVDGRDPVTEISEKRKQIEQERAKRVKVADLLDEYFEKHSLVYKTKSSQKSDKGLIERIKPHLGDLYITELDLPTLTEFYQERAQASSFATANHYKALISSFWNWCERFNYLPMNSNPCSKIKQGKDPKKPVKILTPDEYQRLFKAIDEGLTEAPYTPRAFRALKVLMLTGCRISEIVTLKKTGLDFENGFLYPTVSKNHEEKHPLGAPAIEELRIALQEAPADSELVFPPTRDIPGAVLNLRKAHLWALKRAGLPTMRRHDFRHSFTSMGTDTLGLPMEQVSKTMGHASVATTALYSHISDKTRLNTANKISLAIAGAA